MFVSEVHVHIISLNFTGFKTFYRHFVWALKLIDYEVILAEESRISKEREV